MDVTVDEVGTLTKQLTITLPAENVQPRLDEEYDKLKREVKMKGFRRGKVPRNVILKYYKEQVQGEIGEKLVQETYFDVVEKQDNVDPVTHPEIKEIKYNDDGSFTFIAEVAVRPQFELKEYKGLQVEKERVEIREEEIDEEIERMQQQMTTYEPLAEQSVQDGNCVRIDFQGYQNGTAMPQVKQENYNLIIGSGDLDKEFEKQIVGMNVDEEKTFDVAFPDEHPNNLFRGKTITFNVTLHTVEKVVLPELDDEFVKKVTDSKQQTVQELRDEIKKNLTESKTEQVHYNSGDALLEKLLEIHDFEVPERLVAYEIARVIEEMENRFKRMNITLEQAGLTHKKLTEENREVSEKRVRGDFILKKIAEVEDIKLDDSDMEDGFKRIGDRYNMTVNQVKEFFKNRDDLLPLMNELLNEKILDFLRENAEFIEVDPKKNSEESEKTEE